MKKRIFYIVAMALVVLLSLNSEFISAESISDVNEKLRKLEKEQSEIESKSQDIKREKEEVGEKKDANKAEQSTVQEKLDELEAELVVTQAEIQSVNDDIASTEKEITELESEIKQLHSEIKDLENRIEERNELLRERLRSIQENGGKSRFISVLLGAQNFTDFIMRTTAVNTIMDQDRSIMEEHEQDQNALETKKVEVETKKSDVEAKKDELEAQQATLEGLKAQLDEQKEEQSELKKELEIEYEELEFAELSLDEEQQLIAAEAAVIEEAQKLAKQEKSRLEKEAAEARAKANANKQSNNNTNTTNNNNNVTPSSSGFIRPVAGRISSEYGWRTHPISGERKFHNGIDIAGNNGFAVSAANSGVVAHAGWMGGYGNTVTIVHGDVTTLYAHLSSISVSPGQTVSRGTKIGNVGTTGNSTGPHLHFEVHPNGMGQGTANPRNYVNF